MDFNKLVETISQTHELLKQQAVKAVNISLTLRNWLIGYYIVEFEQNGADRAKYGEALLAKVAQNLMSKNMTNVNERELRRFRLFYQRYSYLNNSFPVLSIWGTVSPVLPENLIRGTVSPVSAQSELSTPPEKLINNLSFSHLAEIIEIEDPLKRLFYEVECIKGAWSVRELRRQISSLYFERSGLSGKPEKLSRLVQSKTEAMTTESAIKTHFSFEFLGLAAREIIEESDLEQALIDHFQMFMLELGMGFCLESRQKRILIGDEYYFVDLVLYHRILKCHVIVEIKTEKFTHAHISQLNTYVNYYKKEVQPPEDNPPIGILLVAEKNGPLVEYALAGLDNQMFVSKYLLKIPSKNQMEDFIKNELRNEL